MLSELFFMPNTNESSWWLRCSGIFIYRQLIGLWESLGDRNGAFKGVIKGVEGDDKHRAGNIRL